MNIDRLPDDCLLHVFNLFNEFEALLNFSEVCKRWKDLVLKRLLNVKYLSDNSLITSTLCCHPTGTILFQNAEKIDLQTKVVKWLPKLKILAFDPYMQGRFFENLTVKGLIVNDYDKLPESITLHNPALEMLAISYLCSFLANDIQGPMLKQLFVSNCNVSEFAEYAKYLPNLKRLHIGKKSFNPREDKFYTGPVLEKLEILEISLVTDEQTIGYHGFSLADHCPALKSAYHEIHCREWWRTYEGLFVNSGIKNHSLEDLVLEFVPSQDWSVLRRILSKYPSLKHLAIRGGGAISDENIPELLMLLPHLVLIDCGYSEQLTEESTEYIEWYCRVHNRSISFYYQNNRAEITKKWPQISSEFVAIGQGFDFMKHCFNKPCLALPHLLEPDE